MTRGTFQTRQPEWYQDLLSQNGVTPSQQKPESSDVRFDFNREKYILETATGGSEDKAYLIEGDPTKLKDLLSSSVYGLERRPGSRDAIVELE